MAIFLEKREYSDTSRIIEYRFWVAIDIWRPEAKNGVQAKVWLTVCLQSHLVAIFSVSEYVTGIDPFGSWSDLPIGHWPVE